jgi:hypothetical protein
MRACFFAAAVAAAAAQPTLWPSLQVWYNPVINDNAVVATAASIASLGPNYTYYSK